tara:strand:+ start:401 stop:1207 length:807 start_codon:yes stop_codon:yes gene_type:complete
MDAEKTVSKFYNSTGWETKAGITEDAYLFEDLRNCSQDYLRRCRLRLLEHIPPKGDYFMDMASGPIQYPEYLKYSEGYDKRYCVDLSKEALIEAEKKIGNHGVYLHGSFFDLKIEKNKFDCIVSIHTIYHMDQEKQYDAIRKLIRITKTGAPLIIIYSNPNSLTRKISKVAKSMKSLWKRKILDNKLSKGELYFYPHPLSWWRQFEDEAEVDIVPWRTFGKEAQEKLFPDNFFGVVMFKILFYFEKKLPKVFNNIATYPMIVLTKTSK